MRNGVIASLLVVALIIGLAFGVVFFPRTLTLTSTQTTTLSTVQTTTLTITLSSSAASHVVTEQLTIFPLEINYVCVNILTYTTSTIYLIPNLPGYSAASSIGSNTAIIKTEMSRALNTTTVYDNVTEVNSGTTCTLINPHYNATQTSTCPPCV